MKKLINKLFEWLGYVPKCYKTSLTKRLAIESEILKCGVGYKMVEKGFEYKIFATTTSLLSTARCLNIVLSSQEHTSPLSVR
jgi:hypothetical protein